MAARLCLRDVGRAMNYSYAEVDRIAKMIPTIFNGFMTSPLCYFTNISSADLLIVYHKDLSELTTT